MKFVKSNFLNHLNRLVPFSKTEKHLVLLRFDKLPRILFDVYDGEVEAGTWVNCFEPAKGSAGIEPFVVDFDLLLKAVKSLSDDDWLEMGFLEHCIEISSQNGSIQVKKETDSVGLREYVELLKEKPVTQEYFDGKTLALCSTVSFCASADNGRETLQNIHFTQDRMEATDAFKVSIVRRKQCFIPGLFSARMIKKLANLYRGNEPVLCCWKLEGIDQWTLTDGIVQTTFGEGAHDAPFPKCEDIVPKKVDLEVAMNKALLLDTLRRLKVLAETSYHQMVQFQVNYDGYADFYLKCKEDELKARFSVRYEPRFADDGFEFPFRVSLNVSWLVACIAAVDKDSVVLGFNKPLTPVLIRPDDENSEQSIVLMPMQMPD